MADNLVTTSPSRFTVIQPDLLPQPQFLQSIDTEDIIGARMARLKALWSQYDPPMAAQYDVDRLEFDPLKIQAEVGAYFEALLRDRVNQAGRSVTLAYAVGSDLDAIGSRYPYGGARLDGEGDDIYRQRLWMLPSILSLNGPGQGTYESYVFWALSTPLPAGERSLRHATAFTQRGTGRVIIPIISDNVGPGLEALPYSQWDPRPTPAQISAVYQFITAPGMARKGLTDEVSVIPPKVRHATIDATINFFPGVDQDAVILSVRTAVAKLVAALRWLGADLTMLALGGALSQPGVYNVIRRSPADDEIVGPDGIVKVDLISIVPGSTGE